MKNPALVGLLVVGFVILSGCGNYTLQHYPAGLSQQEAARQEYQCEREAETANVAQKDDKWINVAEMKNACLAAKGWTK